MTRACPRARPRRGPLQRVARARNKPIREIVLSADARVMAKYKVPPNIGKVRVAMALGGKYAVWNGKTGKHEWRIFVRTKRQAHELATLINEKRHDGEVEVWE